MASVTKPLWVLLLVGLPVAAQPLDYAERLEVWALQLHQRERDPAPEGKQVDEVIVASEEIVAPSDPWPDILNIVHVRTREEVIRKELLVKVGDAWDATRIAETERVLRALGQTAPILATAYVIPVRSATPGRVGMLVVTKDLWSIRTNNTFLMVGPIIKQLRVRPTENNLLGRNKQISLDLDLQQATFGLGQQYSDPRVLGSNFSASETAGILFNRNTLKLEGSRGEVVFARPQYSLEDVWSASTGAGWSVRRARVFRGTSPDPLPYPTPDSTTTVPFVYDGRSAVGSASVTRSFGRWLRTSVSGILAVYSRRYLAPTDTGLSLAQRDWLTTTYLPRSEDATYVGVTLSHYKTDYRVYKNLSTFALPEDVRLGHALLAKVRYAPPLLPTGSHFAEGGIAAGYTWDFFGDLFSVSGATSVRLVPGASGAGLAGPWVNRRGAFELKNITPRLGIGRLVSRVTLDVEEYDLDKGFFLLGGGNGLRGAPDGALKGTKMALFNVEYRTVPIEILTAHLGLVFFWDGGSAYNRSPKMTHTLGLGIRALFPQLDVEPFRIDLGFVINGPPQTFLERVSSSFGQITRLRPSLLDDPLD